MFSASQTSFLTNQQESDHFLKTALQIRGSVTTKVMPRVLMAVAFSGFVVFVSHYFPTFSIPITPFEYSGVVLGLLLVLRVNAGMERWWEARKIWGSIVNQSRNLAMIGFGYSKGNHSSRRSLLHWIAAWPHVMRESLRKEAGLRDVEKLIGIQAAKDVRDSAHMPSYVGFQIISLLSELRNAGLDDFSYQRAERERALLIDAIGACERIRDTPIPLALAIKTRRFILLFLLLLPLALVERAAWLTPLVVLLASYPLFCLDEIGVQLQRPFSKQSLSHLPLETICQTVEKNVLGLWTTPALGTAKQHFQVGA